MVRELTAHKAGAVSQKASRSVEVRAMPDLFDWIATVLWLVLLAIALLVFMALLRGLDLRNLSVLGP